MIHLWKRLEDNQNKGFSLVEVVIAMTILAMVAAPLMKYFSDSLRYSALMAIRQKATALSQQTVEDIKLDENLWDTILADLNPATPPAGGVTELSVGGSTYNIVNNSIDVNGIGGVVLSKSVGKYDVEVSLTSDLAINQVDHSVVYGIDDHEDVMAVERDQLDEALLYFVAINNAYVLEYNAAKAPTDPDIDFMSEDDVKTAVSRKIVIDITHDGSFYNLLGWYEYTAEGLRGTGSTDSITSSYIMDVKTASLSSIYVLFDRMLKADGTPKSDELNIVTHSLPASATVPTLVVICQNLPNDNSNSTYEMKISVPTEYASMVYRSNILSSASPSTGQLKSGLGANLVTKDLSDSKKSIRVLGLNVSVFPLGHGATDVAYATMNTTKGD